MSDALMEMTDVFRRHRDVLKRQIDMLENGKFSGVYDQLPNAVAIEETKSLLRSIIEEMDRLIVDYGG